LLCAWVPNRTLGLFWLFALCLGTKQNIGLLWKRRGGEGDEGNIMKSKKRREVS
jgi:hypothetical protein